MGSQNSSISIEDTIPKEYKPHPHNSNLLVSILDNTILQKQTIIIESQKQLEREREIFLFRRCNSDHVVTAKYFGNVSYVNMCSSSYHISYYVQYCKKLFNKLENLSIEKAYVYLVESLKGFNILTKKFGYFNVNPEMILINQQKKLKVWISDKFSQTRIPRHKLISSQFQFLKQIVRIFDAKLPNSTENNFFWNIIKRKNYQIKETLTIIEAINILVSYYPSQFLQKQAFVPTAKCYSVKNTVKNSFQKIKNPKQTSLKKKKKQQIISSQNKNHSDFLSTKKNSVFYATSLKKRSVLDMKTTNQVNNMSYYMQNYDYRVRTPNFGQDTKRQFFPKKGDFHYPTQINYSQIYSTNLTPSYRSNKVKTQESYIIKKSQNILETAQTTRSPIQLSDIKKIIEIKQTQTKKFITFDSQLEKPPSSKGTSQKKTSGTFLSPHSGIINQLATVNSIACSEGSNLMNSLIL